MDLTIDELNILIEAMKEWEMADDEFDGENNVGLAANKLVSGESSADDFEMILNDELDRYADRRNQREELSTIIRAKLITLRNDMEAEES